MGLNVKFFKKELLKLQLRVIELKSKNEDYKAQQKAVIEELTEKLNDSKKKEEMWRDMYFNLKKEQL